MRRNVLAVILFFVLVLGSACGTIGASRENMEKEYARTAITLSDFSYKVVGYYEDQKLAIPKNFDTKQFFEVLELKYTDKARMKSIQDGYRVLVRPIDDGYSAMLCDPKTGVKIMEDLSCHLDHVEIKSWQNGLTAPCEFEENWKRYCR